MGYIGQRMTRVEDERLVTGKGRYVSDITPPGTLHLAIVRSLHAHAKITGLDFAAARNLAGVVGVYGPKDLAPIMRPLPKGTPDPRLRAQMPTPLAIDRVHYVGEPVAVVVAENRYIAEDAAQLVEVGYEPLSAITDPVEGEHAPPIHLGSQSNLAAEVHYTVGSGAAALSSADHVVEVTLRLGRVVGHPMEPRGIVAIFDPDTKSLLVYAGTQGVHGFRHSLAEMLQMPDNRIRVVAPDTGGGFGLKTRIYAEDVLATYLAVQLKRPIKWAGDRREEFMSTNQERDQVHYAKIGVKSSGEIVAVVDHFFQDQGAYTPSGIIVPDTTAICIMGPYRVPHFEAVGKVVYTNKVSVGPYRGAGRPQGTFVMERLLDHAADALGMDRVEIRRINLLTPDQFPYHNGIPARGASMTLPYGEYQKTMDQVVAAIDYDTFRDPVQKGDWKLGVGVANYLGMSGGFGFEGAKMRLLNDGRIEIATGSSSQGQGHRTAIAQVAADRLNLPFEQFVVVEGDTDAIERGIGTFGSRTMMMTGNATAQAAPGFRKRLLEYAAQIFEAAPEDLQWDLGRISVTGVPTRSLSLAELAKHAASQNVTLEVAAYFDAVGPAFGMGTHGVVVAVNVKTWAIEIRDYRICHDGGVLVNPLLVEGQTIGGTVQGIGTALFESLIIDPESGQPLNATFLDYLLPAAGEMPDFKVTEVEYPDPTNPEGFKGVAEGGIMPPMAAICAAVENALRPWSVHADTLPITPSDLFYQVAKGGIQ